MKTINEIDFREYKKLAIGLTHEMEDVKDKFEKIMNMKKDFEKSKLEMTDEQINEIKEYEDRLQECIEYFNQF